MSGLAVARILGIEVRLHLSGVFIVAIITVTVGTRLEAVPGGPGTGTAWAIGAIASIVFMFTVVAHELAHAIVSRRVGIPVDAVSVHFIGSPAAVDVRASTARAGCTRWTGRRPTRPASARRAMAAHCGKRC